MVVFRVRLVVRGVVLAPVEASEELDGLDVYAQVVDAVEVGELLTRDVGELLVLLVGMEGVAHVVRGVLAGATVPRMNNVIRHDFTPPQWVAEVTFDAQASMWVVVCDALGIATEGDSYESALGRFWSIAPEIATDNGVPFDSSTRVEFRHVEDQASHPRKVM